jgi:hypothetical protein
MLAIQEQEYNYIRVPYTVQGAAPTYNYPNSLLASSVDIGCAMMSKYTRRCGSVRQCAEVRST